MTLPENWNGKPYYSLDAYCRGLFGQKVYKLSLDGGMTCPNRDGTLGTQGCIFCSAGGSGDFAAPASTDFNGQIEAAKSRVKAKYKGNLYIAYFQAYTNTYAPVSYLENLFTAAIKHPEVAALSIATRPDCLPPDVLSLLEHLNQIKPVWVELGLQTIQEDTARFIRRAFPLSVYDDALIRLRKAGLTVITHIIFGLPGETREQMLQTASYAAASGIDGIKLQLLHLLKGTPLAALYTEQPFPILSLEEYSRLVVDCIAALPSDIAVHRLTGDGPKHLLLEPLWSCDKHKVLNHIMSEFKTRGLYQGIYAGK